MIKIWLLSLLLILAGCSEGFHHTGEGVSRELVFKLKEIDRYEDLLEQEDALEKKFQKLVDVMIAARKGGALAAPMGPYAEALQQELIRIYQIEGACEIIERAQREALIRLDAFDRKLRARKEIT